VEDLKFFAYIFGQKFVSVNRLNMTITFQDPFYISQSCPEL